MSPIGINSFLAFCKSREGKVLDTVGGRAEFELSSVAYEAFYYTPTSTGKIRKQAIKYIERILERYEETKSLSPKDYLDITLNASYILALIKLYGERNSK